MPASKSIVRVALAALFFAAAPALAAPPDPFAAVPKSRTESIVPGDTDRVFGGREVPDGQYPFQVALLKTDSLSTDPESQYSSQFCGGTLIAANWVLTAAHCMRSDGNPLTPDAFVVLAGSTDLESGRRIAPKSIFINQSYDENSMDHDVALVELSEPVDAAPVALGTPGAATRAIVVGWGMTEDEKYPRHLLETDLDVVANAECNIGIKAIYAAAVKSSVADLARQYRLKPGESDRIADELAAGLVDPLTDAMLCAGIKTGGRDSCYGDSGGPLLATEAGRPVQIGIVSWGEGPSDSEVKCGHADVYGVYSRIDSFRDWIDSHIHGATP
ncbi:MAG TPA: serine protease [Devosia sp.]|nr:serine protease [Devosia sp.]